jgi:hypothetical protein
MVIKIAGKFVTFDYIVDKSAARKKIFLPHFYNLVKSLQPRPCPTPCLHRPRAGVGKTKKLAPLEGAEGYHGGDVCVCGCGCVSILVPTLKNYRAGVFRSHLNLNSCKAGNKEKNCPNDWVVMQDERIVLLSKKLKIL